MMFSQKIVLSAVLVLASFNFGSAQERKDFDLSLREVVVVDLDHEERFAGEGGPLVNQLLLLVFDGEEGLNSVLGRSGPDPAYYVDDFPARIVTFDVDTVVFVVPAPENPQNAVFWRLDYEDIVAEQRGELQEQKLIGQLSTHVDRDLAAKLAASARRNERPSFDIGRRLDAARTEKISPDDLLALSLGILGGKL